MTPNGNEPHPGDDDGLPLAGLGDVQREMARVYRDMRKHRIESDHGSRLINALNCLAGVMQDKRDSLWTKRAAKMWEEREQRNAQPAASH